MKSETFKQELNTIVNDDIKEFAKTLLDNAPDYFFTVAASSSGRYHPEYSLGEGGLVRHTKAVIRFLNHMLNIEQTQREFTEREQDLLRVAGMAHDMWKHGVGESKHTVFEHPLVASEEIKKYIDKNILPSNEIEYIASSVSTHMGQWAENKKSKIVLPKPSNAAEKIIHLCDYLASRTDIILSFDNYEAPEPPKIEDYEMGFGKFKGVRIKEAFAQEKSYFDWLMSQDKFPVREPLKGFVKQLMKGE